MSADKDPPLDVSRIGPFEIIERLEPGGMGELFLAKHPSLPKKIILKTVKDAVLESSSTAIERLRREANLQGRIEHPNICPVIDVFTDAGKVFVVMPFIEGEPLSKRIRRAADKLKSGKPISVAWADITEAKGASTPVEDSQSRRTPSTGGDLRSILRLVETIARAVESAHASGVIHRDLKPGNIMIRPSGEPVVLDFGLALDLQEGGSRLTQQGDQIGTPWYMAPEQVMGERDVQGRATDVYALGVILYELITLMVPYRADKINALYKKIIDGDAVSPRKLNPSIPPDLAAVCLKAIEADPGRRYATALEFAEDLRRVRVLEPTKAKPPSFMGRLNRRARRSPFTTLTIAAAVLLACAAGGIRILQSYSVTSSLQSVSAFERVRRAKALGAAPDPADELIVNREMPDEATRSMFFADANSPEAFERFVMGLQHKYRGPGDESGGIKPVWPRGGTTETAPEFRFVMNTNGKPAPPLKFRLFNITEEEEIDSGAPAADPSRQGNFIINLSASVRLKTDCNYSWNIYDANSRAPLQEPLARATFRVVDIHNKEHLLAALHASGDATHDLLARASALLSIGLARDAEIVLAEFPSSASPDQLRHAMLLKARIEASLGKDEDVAKLQKEYLNLK
ncbi:MAG: serine/threonine protein kinase [Planctomycetes bacterium]|nr:serine/threonine protein kinase [Planctomycetota bacterium]